MKLLRFFAIGIFTLFGVSLSGSDYEDTWGPAVGTTMPELAVKDTNGDLRSVQDLIGEKKGLLLFFTRSTNW